MKKHIFLTAVLSALLFSIALFTGCHDRDTELPDVAETTVLADTAPGDGDHQLTGRTPCVDGTECTVTVTVTAGAGDFTICGMSDAGTACSDSNS